MAKVLKVVAIVAGVVAVVATAGAALAAAAPVAAGAAAGTGAFLGMSAATWGLIGAIAGITATAASFGAQLLAKPPPARGSVNQLIVETNAVHPYAMGRTYFGGVLRHVASYGPTLDKVPNPYLSRVVVYSGAGPIDGFEALQVDYGPISAYYSGFLTTSSQLGLCPESTALTAGWSGFPNWTANHKLSGQAAAMWNFKFDKNGKVFASGLPQTGAVLRGVKVYDPRLDSTFPGGSGSQRINDEATWAYSDNPALHALTYAYGRYQNGKKVFGVGLPVEAIDLTSFAAWANVCDANDWTISGLVFEPDDRWKNLKDIMAAGGAEPIFSGAKLSAKYHAPRIALDVISPEDVVDGDVSVTAMRSYRERINTIVPKWRSEANNWDYVPGEAVAVSTYVTEDGEEKKEERQYNLVANANQAAQLATYELLERRELGTIELTCGPRMLSYRPGECLMLDLPDEGLDGVEAVILSRVVDPGSMSVRLTLLGETSAKHAFALGKTGTPPPTPSLTMTQEERDNIAAEVKLPTRSATVSLFQRTETSTAPTVTTSGFATYNFDTGAISGQPAGWTIDVPSTGGGYLWSIRAIAEAQASIDIIYNTEWSAPARIAQDGTSGASATSAYLTKEAVQLWAYANGGVVSYAPATGSFKVFSGNTDISSNFTLSTVSNPQALTVAYSGQTYTVTGGLDVGEDTATLTIRATGSGSYIGLTFDKVFSIAKATGGYEIVASLPGSNLFNGRIVYLTTDGKLYRYVTGTGWTAATAAADLTGQITSTQITDGAISTPKLAAGSVDTAKLTASAVTTDKIAAGAITAAKVGTNEIVALSANIKDGVIETAKIGDLQVSTLKIANFAVNAVSSAKIASTPNVSAGGNSGNILQITFNKIGGTESNILIQVNAAPVSARLVAFMQLQSAHAGTLAQAPAIAEGANNNAIAACVPMSLYYVDTGLAAGTYTYWVSFDNPSTQTLLITNYVPVTLTVQEVKK